MDNIEPNKGEKEEGWCRQHGKAEEDLMVEEDYGHVDATVELLI